MKMDEYQKKAFEFNNVSEEASLFHSLTGLVEEVGELAGKFKRLSRGDFENISDTDFNVEIRKEIGDVLWYVADFCTTHGFSLEEVAKNNLEKLTDRKTRGVIKGKGDKR